MVLMHWVCVQPGTCNSVTVALGVSNHLGSICRLTASSSILNFLPGTTHKSDWWAFSNVNWLESDQNLNWQLNLEHQGPEISRSDLSRPGPRPRLTSKHLKAQAQHQGATSLVISNLYKRIVCKLSIWMVLGHSVITIHSETGVCSMSHHLRQ